jgi:lipoprotein-releasing system permease protein
LSFPNLIAKRLYKYQDDKHKVSRPVIKIAILGIAVGLAVMLLTVAIVIGFKQTINDKITGFSNQFQVANFLTVQGAGHHPICLNDSLSQEIKSIEGVKHIQKYTLTQGILKTNSDFNGINFKGIGQDYNIDFLKSNLITGEIPNFTDSAASNHILISKITSDKLDLNTGDKVFAYFISESDVRARRFVVSGIYQTNLAQFDEALCFTDIYTTNKINHWNNNLCTGAEISLIENIESDKVYQNFVDTINRTSDSEGNVIGFLSVKEQHPQIFTWLELLDLNVWIIIVLMICVAGFTMISGLLIIILERTQMIGTLKAFGATNNTIRKIFLWFSFFIIGKGLILGNILGIGIILIQNYTGIITLDPSTYYVKEVPMQIDLHLILLINIATLLICMFVLIMPTYMISRINPAKSIRYE